MGEVLVMVVMVAAGSIRVDMSTQLRIDLKIVYLYSGKQNKHTAKLVLSYGAWFYVKRKSSKTINKCVFVCEQPRVSDPSPL